MTGCLVDFQAPVLRSLTNVWVENLNPLTAPSPLGWLEHLSRLPSLTRLCLTNSMYLEGRSMLSSTRTNQIELPFLSALRLDASLDNIHIFIKGLKFPVNCTLTMCCSECCPGPKLDIVLETYLHRLDYELQLRPENYHLFISAETSTVLIRNWYIYPCFNLLSYDYNMVKPGTPLFLNLVGNSGSGESLLGPVLYTLQETFSKFTSLELHLPAEHPSLIPCLVRAIKLTQLCNVSVVMTESLLQIIQPSDVIPLPALHTIMFSYDHSTGWGFDYEAQAVLSFLTWRRIVGHPITRIIFRNCRVSEDTISCLESLGIQVDRDV